MHFSVILFESFAFLLFVLINGVCIKQRRTQDVFIICSGAFYGVLLESAIVLFDTAYVYNANFVVQLGTFPKNVPICIGLYWGLIIFACMSLSNRIGFANWTRPFLDALLALTIDLSMDTIAIRVAGGYWSWISIPKESSATFNSFFGVNYGNFVGWYLVVLLFSVLVRLCAIFLRKRTHPQRFVSVVAFIFIPLVSTVLLYYILQVIYTPFTWIDTYIINLSHFGTDQGKRLLVLICLILTTLIVHVVSWKKSGLSSNKDIDIPSLAIFSFFHLLFLSLFFLEGIENEAPGILIVALASILADIFAHLPLLKTWNLYRKLREV